MRTATRVIKFLIAGGIGAATNIGILYVLVEFFGLYPVFASVVSFTCAVGVSFALQKFWTFANHSLSDTREQAKRFLVIAIINLGINSLLMYLFIEFVHVHYIPSQIITAGFVAVESYFVYKFFVFSDADKSGVE